MSKRKVQFRDSELEELVGSSDEPSERRFKEKHSLDSDEEDNEDDEVSGEKYRLKSEDLEGQEDTTILHDGNIKITPFNLNEEMEEGYFDSEGNYFENDDKEIHDEWLDSAEFQNIHEGKTNQVKNDDPTGQFEDAEEQVDKKAILSQVLDILKPGETVTKALKRLGASGGSSSASARLRAKKQKLGKEAQYKEETEQMQKDKEMLLGLTGLADQMLQVGGYYIYQETYEQLSKRLKTLEEIEEDDELEAAYSRNDNDNDKSASEKQEEKDSQVLDEVYWQYKWENTEDADIYGPFSSSQMLEWQNQDYFKDDVWVRKVADHETPFYNSKRIDFELYT